MSTQISALAQRIADSTDTEYDSALTLATAYAVQCGYTDLPEGGQAPDAEVSDADADFILEAAGVAVEAAAPTVLDDIAAAARGIEEAIEHRDTLIRQAFDAGVPKTHIAKAAGLSRERIYQIRDGRR